MGIKKLDWYIIKKFLGSFIVALGLLTVIVIIFDLSEKIDDFVQKEAPLKAIVVDYYLNFIPYFMNMRNAKWTDDFTALDPEGTSFVDHYYPRADLHHLFVAKEMFAAMVATEHNLAFYLDLVRTASRHIEAGDFAAWKDVTVNKLTQRL